MFVEIHAEPGVAAPLVQSVTPPVRLDPAALNYPMRLALDVIAGDRLAHVLHAFAA